MGRLMRVLFRNTLRLGTILFIIVLISSNISAQLADSPWPTYRGNLRNTGQSPYDTSHVDGTLKWMFKPENSSVNLIFESSPTIGKNGTIYVGSHENNLYAVNPDGSMKWMFDIGEPVLISAGHSLGYSKGVLSSPAISVDGTIYIRSMSNFLIAVNPDGSEKWRYPVKVSADTWSSPTIGNDGTIYVGSAREGNEGGIIHAINPDGSKKWDFKTESDVFPTMAINEDGIIYSGNGATGKFYAINPDGSQKWVFQTGRHIESSAAIGEDGTIYTGSWDNNIYAISPDGTKKWEYPTGGEGLVASPGIGNDGTIYFSADDGYLYAFNPDGSKKWEIELGLPGETSSSPTIGAEGTIYLGYPPAANSSFGFFGINPNGTVKWIYYMNNGISASPSIGSDGTVYISTHDGLYAFGGPDENGEGQDSESSDSAPGPCEYDGVDTIYDVPMGSEYGNEEFIVIANVSDVTNLSQLIGLTCLQYIDYLNYLSGDIISFSGLTNIKVINLNNNPEIYGDICALSNATNLRDLRMAFNPDIYGDISCLSQLNLRTLAMTQTGISGNLSDLSHMTNLKALYLSGTDVTGDISSLAGLTNLEELNIQDSEVSDSQVYGDLTSLDNLKNLTKVALYNLQVTGCDEFIANHPGIVEGGCSSIGSTETPTDTSGFLIITLLFALLLFIIFKKKTR
jgi:outer membrane protein assembly factor BamB